MPTRSFRAGRGSCGERQRAGHVDRQDAEPRGQDAVEHALAKAGRQPRGDPVANDLLEQAVGDRDAARHGEVRDHLPEQPQHADGAGPAAIKHRKFPDQCQRVDQHEQHVNRSARADGCDKRDALRRRQHQPPRLGVERLHQFALGELDPVAAVDDVGEMRFKAVTCASQLRHPAGQRQQIGDDGASFVAVVVLDRRQGAMTQRIDGAEPDQPEYFADNQRKQRKPRQGGEPEPNDAERRRAREQFLDEVRDRDAERQQHKARAGRPEQRPPAPVP